MGACPDCTDENDELYCGHPACGCECHELADDEDSDDDMPCIGADCVNPHPMHTRRECETVEMYEANAAPRCACRAPCHCTNRVDFEGDRCGLCREACSSPRAVDGGMTEGT